MSGIRQFPPSGNKPIVSQRCLMGWGRLWRHGASQAGSASFHNNQSCSTSSPCFIVIEHSLTDRAACFSVVGSHRRHDYAVLQPHLAYVRWLKNLLESNYSHRRLLSLFGDRIALLPPSLPQNRNPSYTPLVLIYFRTMIVSFKAHRRVQAKAQVDGDVHYGGKGIFDSQKFSIWSSWRKCYNLANATEVCPPSRPYRIQLARWHVPHTSAYCPNQGIGHGQPGYH